MILEQACGTGGVGGRVGALVSSFVETRIPSNIEEVVRVESRGDGAPWTHSFSRPKVSVVGTGSPVKSSQGRRKGEILEHSGDILVSHPVVTQ